MILPTTIAEPGQRGVCPGCDGDYALVPFDGTIRAHPAFRGGPRCDGSGEEPAQYLAPAQVATYRQASRAKRKRRHEPDPVAGDGPEPDPRAVPWVGPRHAQILELLAQGLSNARIGKCLFLSEDTVKAHMRVLMHRFGAVDRTALIVRAVLLGVLIVSAHGDRLIISDEATSGPPGTESLQLAGLAAHHEARPHHHDF